MPEILAALAAPDGRSSPVAADRTNEEPAVCSDNRPRPATTGRSPYVCKLGVAGSSLARSILGNGLFKRFCRYE